MQMQHLATEGVAEQHRQRDDQYSSQDQGGPCVHERLHDLAAGLQADTDD